MSRFAIAEHFLKVFPGLVIQVDPNTPDYVTLSGHEFDASTTGNCYPVDALIEHGPHLLLLKNTHFALQPLGFQRVGLNRWRHEDGGALHIIYSHHPTEGWRFGISGLRGKFKPNRYYYYTTLARLAKPLKEELARRKEESEARKKHILKEAALSKAKNEFKLMVDPDWHGDAYSNRYGPGGMNVSLVETEGEQGTENLTFTFEIQFASIPDDMTLAEIFDLVGPYAEDITIPSSYCYAQLKTRNAAAAGLLHRGLVERAKGEQKV